MDAESARIEHLKLLQAVIDRIGRNAFATRAAAATVVGALAAVTLAVDAPTIAGFGSLPVALLWAIDGYYIRIERQFRARFDRARAGPAPEAGAAEYFQMNAEVGRGGIRGQMTGMFSRPGLVFYVALLLAVGTVAGAAAYGS